MNQLGKYEILEEIGRGGFGLVYKARDLSLDRYVALKVLHPQLTIDTRFIETFQREARNLARINHPNVVTVHEIGESEGRLFIAMRYLSGGSLGDRLKQRGAFPLEQSLEIIKDIAAGLEAGHKRDIIHRDVKPGNILFDEEGQAVIADFGVARAVQLSSLESSTQSNKSVGTPFYRPPELWRGTPPPSPATDVYSLACVLYEMLTGEVLFKGDTPDQVLARHVLDDAFDLINLAEQGILASFQAVLIQALAKDPEDRFQTTKAFYEELEGQIKVADDYPNRSAKGVAPVMSETDGPVDKVTIKKSTSSKASHLPDQGKLATNAKKSKPKRPPLPTWVFWVGGIALVLVITVVLVLSLVFGIGWLVGII